MNTCKDCIHYNVCCDWTSKEAIDSTDEAVNDGVCRECDHYTPKADVVEVVRCKECKHYRAYEPPIEDFDGWCSVNENEYDKEFYCQYGERSENGKS